MGTIKAVDLRLDSAVLIPHLKYFSENVHGHRQQNIYKKLLTYENMKNRKYNYLFIEERENDKLVGFSRACFTSHMMNIHNHNCA